jgi:NhaP-type Na+/H+ or K+/H+ antiporter
MVEQLGFGTLLGLAIGIGGGLLMEFARRKEWMADSFQQIGLVALPLLCLLVSERVGASMFIASFVAGLAVQVGFRDAGKHSVDFAAQWGQLFNLSVFFLFGVIVIRNWPNLNFASWLYAILSLTVVRMLPVAIALVGTRLSSATVVFMGWFGPRGLASIVLGLTYVEQELHLPAEPIIRSAVIVTVLLSISAHGLTAIPGIGLYARKISSLDASTPEYQKPGPKNLRGSPIEL